MRKLLILGLMILVALSGCTYDASAASISKKSAEKVGSSSKKSKSSSNSAVMECSAPSKVYGVAEIDDFLGTSFDICEILQDAQELLSNINEFLEDPTAFIAKKGAQAKSELKSQLTNMVINVSENVIKKTVKAMQGSGDITKAAKDLKGLNKIKAVKDVVGAIKNLKNISETAPKVLNEMNALAGKLSK
jgi:TolA-binding protein